MAIQINNIVGSERQTRTLTGTEITVGIIVSEISTELAGHAKLDWVLNNIGLTYGDSHPDYPEAKLSRIDIKALSHDTAELEVTYIHSISQILVNISTGLYQIETNKSTQEHALNGPDDLIKIAYKYPDDYELDDNLKGKVISKSPTVPKDSHDAILTLTREETTTYLTVLGKVELYVNTLNESGWTVDPLAKEGTYKCVDINAQYNNDRGTYTVNYVFARRPVVFKNSDFQSLWDVDVYYRDERTGEPPSDVVLYSSVDDSGVPVPSPGGLRHNVPIYERKNFNDIITI